MVVLEQGKTHFKSHHKLEWIKWIFGIRMMMMEYGESVTSALRPRGGSIVPTLTYQMFSWLGKVPIP